jgi:hypothetical protein
MPLRNGYLLSMVLALLITFAVIAILSGAFLLSSSLKVTDPEECLCSHCKGHGWTPNQALMILEPCSHCQGAAVEQTAPAAKPQARERRSSLAERAA